MNRHGRSLFGKIRAFLTTIVFLATGLPQALVPEPPLYADSGAVANVDDAKNQSQSTQAQPLDAAFKGKLPITELTEDEAILHAQPTTAGQSSARHL